MLRCRARCGAGALDNLPYRDSRRWAQRTSSRKMTSALGPPRASLRVHHGRLEPNHALALALTFALKAHGAERERRGDASKAAAVMAMRICDVVRPTRARGGFRRGSGGAGFGVVTPAATP